MQRVADVATLLRESILNTLDGFGVYQYPIQFTLTEAVDPATIAENVTLLDLGVSPPAVVPTVAIAGESTRSLPGCVGTEDRVECDTYSTGRIVRRNQSHGSHQEGLKPLAALISVLIGPGR